jgi:hypothetical protein
MDEDRPSRVANGQAPQAEGRAKKPYVKPAFRCERVFETMALACGKISPTQASCRSNRRSS